MRSLPRKLPQGLHQYKRLAREGGWILLGQSVSALALFAGTRVLTEFIPPVIFGSVNLLLGTTALLQNTLAFPWIQAAIRFYHDYTRDQQLGELRSHLGKQMRWSNAAAGAMIIVACAVLPASWGTSVWVCVMLLALYLLQVWRGLEAGFLSAARRQKAYALWSAGESVGRPLLAVAAVILVGNVVESVLLGYLVATAGLATVVAIAVPREGMNRPGGNQGTAIQTASVTSYALPLIPLALFGWISAFSPRYVLGIEIDAACVGLFAASYGLSNVPFLFVQGVVELTLRPVYFEAVSEGRHQEAKRILRHWLFLMAGPCAAGVFLYWLFHSHIASLFLASDYRSGSAMMPLIALGSAFLAMSFTFDKLLYAYRKTGLITISQGIGAATSLAAGIPLINHFGVYGAAITVPVAYGAQLVSVMILARKTSKGRETVKEPLAEPAPDRVQ